MDINLKGNTYILKINAETEYNAGKIIVSNIQEPLNHGTIKIRWRALNSE